jgi:hypothetical protein
MLIGHGIFIKDGENIKTINYITFVDFHWLLCVVKGYQTSEIKPEASNQTISRIELRVCTVFSEGI